MAATEDRLTEELEGLYRAPAVDPARVRSESDRPPARSKAVVSPTDARLLLFLWAAVIGVIFLFEPRADNPNVAVPTWAELAAFGFMSSLLATVAGFGSGRPWAPRASLLAAGFGAVLAIACAVTAHHTGGWWAFELAAFGVIAALTIGAARRAR